MAEAIKGHGLKDLHRALKHADKETRDRVRGVERKVAEPVRVEAQELAAREISRIGREWSTMRTGVTTKVVYIAPKRKRKQGSRRPNLAALLMDKAMEPALEQHRDRLFHDLEDAMDTMAGHFNA